jgi:archaellum component FlaG (FlaF/FlaG flagellin family)
MSTTDTTMRALRRSTVLLAAVIAVSVLSLAVATAAQAGVAWRVIPVSDSTVAPGANLTYNLSLKNTGSENTTGEPTDLTVTLPDGMTAVSADTTAFTKNGQDFECPGAAGATVVKCTGTPFFSSQLINHLTVTVAVDPATVEGTVLTTAFALSGGGAAETDHTVDPVTVTTAPPVFGVDTFDASATRNGVPLTQAGGHPDQLTTSIDFNTFTNPSLVVGDANPVQDVKTVDVELPPGLVGDTTGVDECTLGRLTNGESAPAPLCPVTSQVGVALVRTNEIPFGPLALYNMVPPPGVPARFAFNVGGTIVTLDAHVRTGGDYGLGITASNTPQALEITGSTVTLWGVPSDPSHDLERSCSGQQAPSTAGGPSCASGGPRRAFFRLPTSCTAPGEGLTTTASIDSWQNPGHFAPTASVTSHELPGYPFAPQDWGQVIGITGCESVPFTPSLDARPLAGSQANAPSGFAFDITVPQDESPDTPASQSDVRKVTIALPQGVRVSPSSASGLGACSSDQIALHSNAVPSCPDSSKLGTVTIKTPLLDVPVEGSLFLAKPHDNPFNSLIAVYLVASAKGVVIKLPGQTTLDPVTGQITATFDNMPQLPFENAHVVLRGGPRAPLVMPDSCGTFTTHAQLTGWSGKTVTQTSSFTLTEDSQHQPCPSVFNPGFSAGTSNPVAGSYSPFSLQLTRTDGDGEFSSLSSLSLPKGLLANVASVATRCTIEQADAHACPADSHVGEVTTGAGAGSNPFYVNGDVYLTGPYKGNPFGVAVVVHAQAGPFDLGYVVVKGAIQIHDDGSVTVATDPFPRILQGIPLQIRDVRVNLDRPGFMFNPTSCNPASINGTVLSTDSQQVGVSSRFQVGECANLAFKPSFTVSTVGKTSKANGASLHVHLATHEGPGSTGAARESNIAKVDVQLPVVLPARLPTLQKACTAAQFGADPAGCPVGSFVGTVIAHTPILASPLSGPAILVSHGGEAFPDLVLVLQGEGVRINLTGHTQIKKGITYNHFETVPDAPVSSFDLTLPAGPHGVLTTDVPGRNLCANTKTVTVTKRVIRRIHGHTRKVTVKAKKAVAAPLLMPTTMTAQNGAVIHQTTKIAVTGCPSAKTAKHAKKASRRRR